MTATLLSLGALALAASATLPMGPIPAQDVPIPEDTEIQTTASGLKYSVLQEGDGTTFPGAGDKVQVHYRGWLTNGTEFDSSYSRNAPAEFGVGQVIKGWTEGLQLMSVGSKFKLTIPWELAYGEKGSGSKIPPKSDLIFFIELLEITERGLPFIAWNAEGEVTKTDSGLEYRVVHKGDGDPAKGADNIHMDFAIFEADGTLVTNSATQGALRGAPARISVPFIAEALEFMQAGDHLLFHVPVKLGLPRRPGQESAPRIWQLQLKSAVTVEKPDFQLPPAEELQTTASGLKYKVLREGVGKKPMISSRVNVHYSGWLTDGTPFDSSYERGTPATFGVTQVIAGWTEGLQLMNEGAQFLLVIPSKLGYGDRGSPPKIPGGADLVFVVELLSIQG